MAPGVSHITINQEPWFYWWAIHRWRGRLPPALPVRYVYPTGEFGQVILLLLQRSPGMQMP